MGVFTQSLNTSNYVKVAEEHSSHYANRQHSTIPRTGSATDLRGCCEGRISGCSIHEIISRVTTVLHVPRGSWCRLLLFPALQVSKTMRVCGGYPATRHSQHQLGGILSSDMLDMP